MLSENEARLREEKIALENERRLLDYHQPNQFQMQQYDLVGNPINKSQHSNQQQYGDQQFVNQSQVQNPHNSGELIKSPTNYSDDLLGLDFGPTQYKSQGSSLNNANPFFDNDNSNTNTPQFNLSTQSMFDQGSNSRRFPHHVTLLNYDLGCQ